MRTRLHVEVVYALARAQDIVALQLPEGSSAGDAVAASGLAASGARLGIGGREVNPREALQDGDRVEILRPLAIDPKDARRLRARRRRR